MGTRHLTCVFLDGVYRVAQYGQWDGYPAGQGATCLEFLRKHGHGKDLERFKKNVRKCHWISAERVDKINERIKTDEKLRDSWQTVYPELSRDTGAQVLNYIFRNKNDEILLNDDMEFAADSLFCEWLWLVDLDKNTLECYKGFNHTPLSEDERFFYLTPHSPKRNYGDGTQYYPVRFISSWPLDALPTLEEMINETDPKETSRQEEEEETA